MKNENDFREERFDSFLNKTIILSSKKYFVKLAQKNDKEKTLVDDEEYSALLQNFITSNNALTDLDNIELGLELNNAIKSLSAIEQSVIFLLFNEDLSEDEAAKILEVWSKSISRIKIRAINKIRKHMKGELEDEK